jgi:RND superfamily putative drug exporter
VASFARWCYRHRRIVVIVWIAALVTVIAVERSVGSAYTSSFTLPGTESSRALTLLSASLPKQAGDSDTIVWHVAHGSVNDPAVKTRVEALLGKVAAVPSVAAVRSPYAPTSVAQISRDGKTAYATVDFKQLAQAIPKSHVLRVVNLVKAAHAPGWQVEIGGQAIEEASQQPPSNSMAIGLVIAAVIILLAFGSLVGMALPLVTAAVALSTALFTIDLFSHAASVNNIAPTLAALIGLGVGID